MMSGLLRCGLRCIRCSTFTATMQLHPVRGTCIFSRKFPPPLYQKRQTGPFRPRLEEEHYVYDLEENTYYTPAGNMEVILATDVEGLGFKGDIISVTKRLARNHMLPAGVAEYVTEENLKKYDHIRTKREYEARQTLTAHKTMKQLQHMTLPVPMSSTVPWTLNKTHVKVAFRMCGVELTEDQIELPDEPVTTAKDITVYLTVNELDRVPVNVHIYNYSKLTMPTLPPVWSDSPSAQFNIFDAVSIAAHRMRGLEYRPRDTDADSSVATATPAASD